MPDPQSNAFTDPTHNVLQLVDAAVKRLDDLRDAEQRRVNEIADLHVLYGEKLREAETKRIDAIRAVDVAAVGTASDKTHQQAIVLANQLAATTETLRQLVATTTSQLMDRLALLEKSQYENKGKQGVTSPLIMLIAALAGGLIVWIIQLALGGE